MFYPIVAMLLSLVVLFFIGLGVSLLLFSRLNNPLFLFSISPVIGLIITLFVGTYLVVFNHAIYVWSFPYVVIAMSINFIFYYKFQTKLTRKEPAFTCWLVGLVSTIILLSLPQILGGLDFSVLRGNGTDSFHYISMAGYLTHKPYSWMMQVSDGLLISQHPVYGLAKALLTQRWVTSMLFAFFANLTQVSLVKFEYVFTILFFVLCYGLVYIYVLRFLNIKPWLASLSAVAICTGFWAQFILDFRPMSFISALPLVLLLAILLSFIDELCRIKKTQCCLFAAVFAAVVLDYPEISIIMAFSFFILFVLQLIHKRPIKSQLLSYYAVAIFFSGIVLVSVPSLLDFLIQQFFYGKMGKNDWDIYYFPWLYHGNFLIGLWGMAPFNTFQSVHYISNIFLTLLSLLLTFSFAKASTLILFNHKKNSLALDVVAAVTLSGFLAFFYLYFLGQRWAAGKSLSYIYPFIMLLVIANYKTELFFNSGNKLIKTLSAIEKKTIIVWLLLQVILGIWHIGNAYFRTEYKNYMIFHGEFKQHEWNLDSFRDPILKNCHSLGLDIKRTWLAEYISFVFGWDIPIVSLPGGIYDGIYYSAAPIFLHDYPNCLLIDQKSNFFKGGFELIKKNSEIFLIQISPEKLLNTLKANKLDYKWIAT